MTNHSVMPEKTSKHHILKCLPEFYAEVRKGFKCFEVRKNDRDFKAGDTGELVNTETEERMRFWIPYVLYGGQYGIAEDYCVFTCQTGFETDG